MGPSPRTPADIFAVCSPTATAAGDAIAVLGCGQAAYAPETASWYLLDELPVEPRGLADILTVGALGANDQIVMAMNPRFDPTRPGPRPNGDGSRFVAYEGDFSTYTVPDVEGLPLGAAHRIMAVDGFVLSAHRTDPQGDDAVVRVQEPPPGTRAPASPRRSEFEPIHPVAESSPAAYKGVPETRPGWDWVPDSGAVDRHNRMPWWALCLDGMPGGDPLGPRVLLAPRRLRCIGRGHNEFTRHCRGKAGRCRIGAGVDQPASATSNLGAGSTNVTDSTIIVRESPNPDGEPPPTTPNRNPVLASPTLTG